MKFCLECGSAKVRLQIPEKDNRRRYMCGACGYIHYVNPRVVAGCVPVYDGQVLLCRRAIEPKHGFWTLPAGFMELDETVAQAAERETLEEANARVRLCSLFTLLSLPHAQQVFVMYLAELLDENFSPGPESLDVALFAEDRVPWKDIAFSSVRHTLEFYFADCRQGCFTLHTADLLRDVHGEPRLHLPL